MLRISNMESFTFPGSVLFPTGFTLRGMLQGVKDVGAPPATGAAGVGEGAEERVSLKTCDRIENSGDIVVDPAPEPWQVWEPSTEGVELKDLVCSKLSAALHAACWREPPRLLRLREEKVGSGEGGEDIVRKSVMVVVRVQGRMLSEASIIPYCTVTHKTLPMSLPWGLVLQAL
jgi:hypothetical protein